MTNYNRHAHLHQSFHMPEAPGSTTVTANITNRLLTHLVNAVLDMKPLADFAKNQARQMIIKRAERMGVPWRQKAADLLNSNLEPFYNKVNNPNLTYPSYYVTSFHAYKEGNLSWTAATEVEAAALSVHSTIWPEAGLQGDAKLRQSYHDLLRQHIKTPPRDIVDIGCSVGMSTFALQDFYPEANLTGVDLSPYFLAVASYRSQQYQRQVNWLHAAGENTGLPDASFDLVSLFLICHELPQAATHQIVREARRLLRPGGHLAIMDMNPASEAYEKMPPYVFTLLKSTEPYLDEYFSLDISQTLVDAGFQPPTIQFNSRRHRTIIAPVA